jgi:hypothetical protein
MDFYAIAFNGDLPFPFRCYQECHPTVLYPVRVSRKVILALRKWAVWVWVNWWNQSHCHCVTALPTRPLTQNRYGRRRRKLPLYREDAKERLDGASHELRPNVFAGEGEV